jgi:hypothetical protein
VIQKPTVIVIGAGGSIPYGFPSGYALYQIILSGLSDKDDAFLCQACFPGDRMSGLRLRESLLRSPVMSIDQFLERRSDMLQIGKRAIARALIPFERELELFDRSKGPRWYEYLWRAMGAEFEDFHKNRVSFITYNYDRSLEHFLFCALMNVYGKSAADVLPVFNRIKIIHVHGTLCPYEHGGRVGRTYREETTEEIIDKTASCIKIIHEKIDEEAHFAEAVDLLCNAERIAFIGFGFDPTNVRRLQPERWLGGPHIPLVMGTAFGMTKKEMGEAKAHFKKGPINLYNVDGTELLRASFPLE